MSLVVNNNLMAANTAHNLNTHYGRLATSTQRLSTGLRVNSAADDAAGLAIRELQRADIAALNQGARNANDAISLIQVADGALAIIDEKLIRMKELAEQAATGTYDSTQRMMIDSEYQAMASEITRIANATDFNGIKLLDGTLEGEHDGSGIVSTGKLKVHFGTANDSAEDYYYVEIGDCTSQALGLGNASTWQDVQARAADAFAKSLENQIKADINLTDEEKAKLLDGIAANALLLTDALNNATDPLNAWQYWLAGNGEGFMPEGKTDVGELMDRYLAPIGAEADKLMEGLQNAILAAVPQIKPGETIGSVPPDDYRWREDYLDPAKAAARQYAVANKLNVAIVRDEVNKALGSFPLITPSKDYDRYWASVNGALDLIANDQALKNEIYRASKDNMLQNPGQAAADMQAFWDGLRYTEKQKLQYAFGQAAIYNLANADPARVPAGYGIGMDPPFDFGNDVDPALGQAMIAQALTDMSQKVGHMDFAGFTLETQQDAQRSLVAINNAIVSKDKIRAHLGATQNRLENTVSNLAIQAENLQAAESRISDVDVATEMTQFVRNQILSQSAVAMLGQANSLPQMAMQLIGG